MESSHKLCQRRKWHLQLWLHLASRLTHQAVYAGACLSSVPAPPPRCSFWARLQRPMEWGGESPACWLVERLVLLHGHLEQCY